MTLFYRIVRGLMIGLYKTIFPCRVYGKENLPTEGGYVLCSNHTSMSDVIWLIASNPRTISFMGKAEIFEHAVPRFLFSKMGVFPVRRGAVDRAALRRAEETVKQGGILGIFPEGTRNKEFGPPKAGKSGAVRIALQSGAPLVPVAVYRKGSFCPFRKTVLRYGTPYVPDADQSNREELRAATDDLMGRITALWELNQ